MEENKRAAGRLNEIRQRRIRNRRMIVGISFVVFAFCIVMGIQMVQKNSNLKKLKEQESKLAQQYQQELQGTVCTYRRIFGRNGKKARIVIS